MVSTGVAVMALHGHTWPSIAIYADVTSFTTYRPKVLPYTSRQQQSSSAISCNHRPGVPASIKLLNIIADS